MKTKDAFAFRNFDEKKILGRNFFKDFRLPDGDDDSTLESFNAAKCLTSADAERTLDQLHRLNDKVTEFRRLLARHVKRLRKFWQATSDERAAKLLQAYRWYEEVLELFQLKFGSYFINGEDKLNELYRKEFGARLKAARLAAGMTQGDVALKVGITRNGYQFYESGKRDPSTPTLIKLFKVLNNSPNFFFGATL